MRGFASCVVLSIFLMGASNVAAHDGDDKATPFPKATGFPCPITGESFDRSSPIRVKGHTRVPGAGGFRRL